MLERREKTVMLKTGCFLHHGEIILKSNELAKCKRLIKE